MSPVELGGERGVCGGGGPFWKPFLAGNKIPCEYHRSRSADIFHVAISHQISTDHIFSTCGGLTLGGKARDSRPNSRSSTREPLASGCRGCISRRTSQGSSIPATLRD